jgi:hypothetical protein
MLVAQIMRKRARQALRPVRMLGLRVRMLARQARRPVRMRARQELGRRARMLVPLLERRARRALVLVLVRMLARLRLRAQARRSMRRASKGLWRRSARPWLAWGMP